MYTAYEYNPPASYYEPPEPPSYDKEEARVIDNEFFVIFTYDNGNQYEEILDKREIEETYEVIEEYKEDGLKKIEIYEAVKDFGIIWDRWDDDYEEEISEVYSGELLYSEEF